MNKFAVLAEVIDYDLMLKEAGIDVAAGVKKIHDILVKGLKGGTITKADYTRQMKALAKEHLPQFSMNKIKGYIKEDKGSLYSALKKDSIAGASKETKINLKKTTEGTSKSKTPIGGKFNTSGATEVASNTKGTTEVASNTKGTTEVAPNTKGTTEVAPNTKEVKTDVAPANNTFRNRAIGGVAGAVGLGGTVYALSRPSSNNRNRY